MTCRTGTIHKVAVLRSRCYCRWVSTKSMCSLPGSLPSLEEALQYLEEPDRGKWQMPERVIETLRLREGDVVADIGAGTGYFSRRFARQVAHVYAEDIDPEDYSEVHLATSLPAALIKPALHCSFLGNRPDGKFTNQMILHEGLSSTFWSILVLGKISRKFVIAS
jgi:hypothetical protein